MSQPVIRQHVFGEYRLDESARKLYGANGAPLELSTRAFDVLRCLIGHAGQDLTKAQLMSAGWPDTIVEENNLNQAITAIRRALGDTRSEARYLMTLPGRGYRFIAPVAMSAAPAVAAAEAGPLARPRLRIWITSVLAIAVLAIVGALWQRQRAATPAASVTIAVLPFSDLSEQRDQQYFSDGLAEELLNQLARVPRLTVIARASSFSLRSSTIDAPTIGQKLRATHLLEGSVRRAGETLRVSARLVRADSGIQLWSQTYDRKGADIFRVQDDITASVLGALKLQFAAGTPALDAVRPTNLEAYNQFLIGRQAYERFTAADMRLAMAAYSKATALDPAFGAAFAELGMAVYTLASLTSDKGALRQARAYGERAVALSPDDYRVYGVRAYLRFIIDWDWEGARTDFQRVFQLNPADGLTRRRYATFLTGVGTLQEALEAWKEATRLDPLTAGNWSVYGSYAYSAGQRDIARAALAQAAAIAVDAPALLRDGGAIDLQSGRFDAALTKARKLTETDPAPGLSLMAKAEHSLGQEEASRQHLAELTAQFANTRPTFIASVHAWRGQNDEALAWLKRAVEIHDDWLPRSLRMPLVFVTLRSDPRFADLLRQLRLPPISE